MSGNGKMKREKSNKEKGKESIVQLFFPKDFARDGSRYMRACLMILSKVNMKKSHIAIFRSLLIRFSALLVNLCFDVISVWLCLDEFSTYKESGKC